MMQNFNLDEPSLDITGTLLAEKYDPKVGGQLQSWRATTTMTYYVIFVTEINKLEGFDRLAEDFQTEVSPSEIFTSYIILGKLMGFGCTVCAKTFEPKDVVIMRLELKDSALYNSVRWWETYFDNLKDFEGKALPDGSKMSLVHTKACNDLRQLRGIL